MSYLRPHTIMTTRERIIIQSVETFNQQGYHIPTLADLAHQCDMSRGNLAYHYKDKESILDAIADQLMANIEEIQKDRKAYPAFSNLSLDMRTYAILQERYPFIFRDTSVLEHDSIREVMTSWSQTGIQRNMDAFTFAVKIGNMNPESFQGLYQHLAVNAWLITYYWISQKEVRQITSNDDAERMVWSTIIPHFTDKGIKAFIAYYGQQYLKQLGMSTNKIDNDNNSTIQTTINV